MLSVNPERPVDPAVIAILREVSEIAGKLNLDYFVAGATARDIVLTHVFGCDIARATLDVDLAVAVDDWDQFAAIKKHLTAGGRFTANENLIQRLHYRPNDGTQGYPLDILPFGGVEQPAHTIRWPPDMNIVMNVAGYREVLDNAVEVEIAPGLITRVASIPGLAIMKLFAWQDRGNENSKDALDLAVLFRNYGGAGNMDRLYDNEIALLTAVDYDIDLASPRLLGKDVRSIAQPATLERITALLDDAALVGRLIAHMAPALRATEDSIAAAESPLAQFKAGLNGQ